MNGEDQVRLNRAFAGLEDIDDYFYHKYGAVVPDDTRKYIDALGQILAKEQLDGE